MTRIKMDFGARLAYAYRKVKAFTRAELKCYEKLTMLHNTKAHAIRHSLYRKAQNTSTVRVRCISTVRWTIDIPEGFK